MRLFAVGIEYALDVPGGVGREAKVAILATFAFLLAAAGASRPLDQRS
jgi:hypothetical protein